MPSHGKDDLEDLPGLRRRGRMDAFDSWSQQKPRDTTCLDTSELSYTDDNNQVERFYAILPECINVLREFLEVLIIDCTYRTILYDRSVLKILGVHSSKKTIHRGLALLDKEDKGSFLQAMDQLRKMLSDNSIIFSRVVGTDQDRPILNATSDIFPQSIQIIYQWHMKKDVEHSARLKLGRLKWSEVLKISLECIRTRAFLSLFLRLFYAEEEAEYEQITR
ncbi:hypothetical protein OnM2_075001 [Erysiphe neolycopersici]|uniref:MULE transposase domain-containing protein n=1 Tax=Erysiphe neolycopersici TaxID=212602 RepID=A0A420HIL7_9PEZI|nr:hypothetical protein OnM2_075001 [Erysiphe neolycopersici]